MHFRSRSARPYVRGGLPSDEVAELPAPLRRWSCAIQLALAWMHGIDPAANARQTETRVSATFRTLAR